MEEGFKVRWLMGTQKVSHAGEQSSMPQSLEGGCLIVRVTDMW